MVSTQKTSIPLRLTRMIVNFNWTVMVAQWSRYEQRLETRETRVPTSSWTWTPASWTWTPALGRPRPRAGSLDPSSMSPQRLRSPMLTADLRYQEALDGRKWTKGVDAASSLVRAVLIGHCGMVAQAQSRWYDLRLVMRETEIRSSNHSFKLGKNSSHVSIRSMSPQHHPPGRSSGLPSLPGPTWRSSWIAQMNKRRMQLPFLSGQFWSNCHI